MAVVADPRRRSVAAPGPQRFAWFAAAGVALTSVPYLWVLWDLWTGGVDPLRSEPSYADFYDLQARAIFAGHLYVPPSSLGIEAFIHDGHQYTYFGLFPSLLRMPVLAFTHALDGRLTAPSMLLAWIVTAIFSSLLIWRVRVLVRGDAALGRAEAASLGLVVASITGGSVLVYLAASPWVYDEDVAWSVALTIASLFALVGFLERPCLSRSFLAGSLVLATALDRAPAGYGCELAAILIAVWLAVARSERYERRWCVAALAIGLVPLAVAGLVNTAKFGSPFALPLASQVWTSLNAHRRQFLAANGGKAFSLAFLPTTLVTYFRPTGLHFGTVFPFITLPTTPPTAVDGAFLDLTYPTASVTASMPLLFVLSCWGAIATFGPGPIGRLHLIRLPLVGAVAACSGALLWGYIANRYLADFVPCLALAASVGVVDIWRRLEGKRVRLRGGALTCLASVALFGIVANVGLAMTPASVAWSPTQVVNFVKFQNKISNRTGHTLASTVVHANRLPYYAPAGEMFDIGECSGLYLSSGYSYRFIPDQQYEHWTFFPIEEGPSIVHRFKIVFEPSVARSRSVLFLVRVGRSAIIGRIASLRPGDDATIVLSESDPHNFVPSHPPTPGIVRVIIYASPLKVRLGQAYNASLVADGALDQLSLAIDGRTYLTGPFTPGGPFELGTAAATDRAPILSETSQSAGPASSTSLCRSLVGGK
jgi:hypothetical protein